MAAAATETKKRFEMSPEHKAKLMEGRNAALQRKREAKQRAQEAVDRGEVHPETPAAPDHVPAMAKPRSLLDLFYQYPIGDGIHFIQVNRTRPQIQHGVKVDGVQNPIYQPVTEAEFATFYGGGSYELRVYQTSEGPNGARYKPMTDPVQYVIPGNPNPDSAISEDDMRVYQNGNGRRMVGNDRVATHFEPPQVAVRRLEKEENSEVREEERRERKEREAEDRRLRAERSQFEIVNKVEQTKEKEIERLEESKDRELRLVREAEAARFEGQLGKLEAKLEARQSKPDVDPLEMLDKAARILKPAEQATQAQLQQLIESQKNETARMHAEHEKSLRAERDRADLRIKDAEDRAERRIKDETEKLERRQREIEERSSQRISETEQRAEARIREEQRRADERIRDLTISYDNRLKDLDRMHERDMRAKDTEASMGKSQVEVQLKSKIDSIEAELRRAVADAERYRLESVEYKKQAEDWLGQMQKFEERAEALGWTKDAGEGGEAPHDWKDVFKQIGIQAVTGLPEALKSGAEAISKLRAGGQNPAGVRAMHERQMVAGTHGTVPHTMAALPQARPMPMQQQALPFATEDGPNYIVQSTLPRPPAPPPPTSHAPPPAPPQPVMQPLASVMDVPPQAIQPVVEVEQPQAQPAPQQQQQASVQQPPQQENDDQFDMMIKALAYHCDHKTPPKEVVSIFMQAVPVEHRGVLASITMDQVLEMLRSKRYEEAQKLQRREGAKYLRDVWVALQEAAKTAS